MDAIKRALRKLFQRKDKDEPKKSSAASAKAPTAPPKDGRATTASQQTGAPNPIPSTHPLSTGQHNKPQEAVPQNHTAHHGLAPDPSVAGGLGAVERAREQGRETHNVSPLVATDRGPSEPVSAVERELPPAPPPKVDGAADAVNAAPLEAAVAAPAATDSTPAHIPSTGEPLNPAGNGREANQPDGAAVSHDRIAAISQLPGTTAAQRPTVQIDDDKIPVVEDMEPPPIKAVRAAPGMSATSGPLEDFPEGGALNE